MPIFRRKWTGRQLARLIDPKMTVCQQAISLWATVRLHNSVDYMRICLFQPDIAGNVGTILRTCACLDVPVDIIEPCGFPFGERALQRAGMDYLEHVEFRRLQNWQEYQDDRAKSGTRTILMSSKGATPLPDFSFRPDDSILFGCESAGVPDHVHASADARIAIPMKAGMRSLNVAIAVGMTLAEALRQTESYPK